MLKKLLLVVLGLVASIGMAIAAVNINTATEQELDSLPGVGPAKAKAIVEYRKANGNFKSVDDLKNVKGIGDKTFADLKSQIAVSGATTVPAASAAKGEVKADAGKAKDATKEAAKDVKADTKAAAKETKAETKAVAAKVEDKAEKGKDAVKAAAKDAKADVKAAASSAASSADAKADKAKAKADKKAEAKAKKDAKSSEKSAK